MYISPVLDPDFDDTDDQENILIETRKNCLQGHIFTI